MEAQYYVPTIDEFFCGFECEIKGKNESNWSKIVLGRDAVWHLFTNLEYLDQATEQIRVKRLDRQDIEECGWIDGDFEPKRLVRSDNEYFLDDKFVSYSCYEIRPTEKDNEYTIFDCDWECVFKGTIRNKSELVKLMQMLNIK